MSSSRIENFKALKKINHNLVHVNFQGNWNFKLEIYNTRGTLQNEPKEFDLYIKDITYSLLNIATDEEEYGGATHVWPKGEQPMRISFTARENEDGRITKYLKTWKNLVVSSDGTVGLPLGENGYVRIAKVYNLDPEGGKIEDNVHIIQCYPTEVGEISRAYENVSQFLEIPVTLMQFSTIR